MKARLSGEGLRLADLQGKLFGGTLSGLFELRNTGGTGLLDPAQARKQRSRNRASRRRPGRQAQPHGLALGNRQVPGGDGGRPLGLGVRRRCTGLTVSGLNAGALPALIARGRQSGPRHRRAAHGGLRAAHPRRRQLRAQGCRVRLLGRRRRAPRAAVDARSGRREADHRVARQRRDRPRRCRRHHRLRPGRGKVAGSEPVVRFSLEGTPRPPSGGSTPSRWRSS